VTDLGELNLYLALLIFVFGGIEMRNKVPDEYGFLNKDKQIHIRVNEPEYKIITELAKRNNMSVSKLIVSLSKEEFLHPRLS
jgi:hypothetical protein